MLVLFSLFNQLRKIQQASPGATQPKLPQHLASFSALPLCYFSAQKNTHKNNQWNLCMFQAGTWSPGEVSGHRQKTVSRKETVFLCLCSRTNCSTSINAHHPKSCQAGLGIKLCEQKIFFSSTTKKDLQTSHVLLSVGSLLVGRVRSDHLQISETGTQKLKWRSWADLGWTLGLEGKRSLTRGTTREQLVTSYLPYSKSPTPKELINSHLERQKSPQGRECAGGGTSEGKKSPDGWGLVAYMQLRWG